MDSIRDWMIALTRKGRDCMSKIMVAGFVQMETIVKVEDLPVPYKQFESTPTWSIPRSGVRALMRRWRSSGSVMKWTL